jgi:hypothetical protein
MKNDAQPQQFWSRLGADLWRLARGIWAAKYLDALRSNQIGCG